MYRTSGVHKGNPLENVASQSSSTATGTSIMLHLVGASAAAGTVTVW
jgi:hypothetical protein